MTIAEWSGVAQVVISVFTVIGVVVSLYYSRRAMREVTLDRALRHRPYLAFEGGGNLLPVRFVKAGASIPGVHPEDVARVFADLPPDAESVRLKDTFDEGRGSWNLVWYGTLVNFGSGPALETRVTWQADEVTVGSQTFKIDEVKRQDRLYCDGLNAMPCVPQHIAPGQSSRLSRLPTFIEKDTRREVSRVAGRLLIKCVDLFGKEHRFQQGFHVSTRYSKEEPCVFVTFRRFEGQVGESEPN